MGAAETAVNLGKALVKAESGAAGAKLVPVIIRTAAGEGGALVRYAPVEALAAIEGGKVASFAAEHAGVVDAEFTEIVEAAAKGYSVKVLPQAARTVITNATRRLGSAELRALIQNVVSKLSKKGLTWVGLCAIVYFVWTGETPTDEQMKTWDGLLSKLGKKGDGTIGELNDDDLMHIASITSPSGSTSETIAALVQFIKRLAGGGSGGKKADDGLPPPMTSKEPPRLPGRTVPNSNGSPSSRPPERCAPGDLRGEVHRESWRQKVIRVASAFGYGVEPEGAVAFLRVLPALHELMEADIDDLRSLFQ